MQEVKLRFPVNCPVCDQALLIAMPVGLVAEALIAGSPIRLHASCHDVYWDATQLEIEQIRQYLGAVVLAHPKEP
jgi:hypothetical protein